jgi:putative Mn2+ efflux pump MntP
MSISEFLFSLGAAFALGCDAFAVGMAVGTRSPCSRACFRLWFHFGLFQFLMPIIGWYSGKTIIVYFADYDHWIAFGLVFVIASKMLFESLKKDEDAIETKADPTRGLSLVGLSLATSMDALGLGLGMGVTGMNLFFPAVIIGVVASIMTWTGLKLGKNLSARFGKKVETFGALILYLIAFKLLSI